MSGTLVPGLRLANGARIVPTRLADGTLTLAHYSHGGDLLALTRYVRTEAGAKRYGLPIGSPIGGGAGGKVKAVAAKATAKTPKVSAPSKGAGETSGRSLTVRFGGKSATFRRTADGTSERKDPITGAWRPSNGAEASLHNAAEQRHSGPASPPAAPVPVPPKPQTPRDTKPTPAAKPSTPPASSDTDRAHTATAGAKPKVFGDATEAENYLESTKRTLPKAQRDAVRAYSENGFYAVNQDLRAGEPGSDKLVAKIDAAMAPLPDDLMLERGVNAKAFGISQYDTPAQQWAKLSKLLGSTHTDEAYMSTSAGPTSFTDGGIVMRIAAPKGTPALNTAGVTKFTDEREVLLARKTRLHITGVKRSGGKIVFNAVVLPAEGKVAA